jgi:hypothetical protein
VFIAWRCTRKSPLISVMIYKGWRHIGQSAAARLRQGFQGPRCQLSAVSGQHAHRFPTAGQVAAVAFFRLE